MLFSLRLSFQVAFLATLFAAPLGILIAYLLAMKNFRGKGALDAFLPFLSFSHLLSLGII
jgi:ABC-type sulfate transport system permease component